MKFYIRARTRQTWRKRETDLAIHVKKSASKSHTVIKFLTIGTFNIVTQKTRNN